MKEVTPIFSSPCMTYIFEFSFYYYSKEICENNFLFVEIYMSVI